MQIEEARGTETPESLAQYSIRIFTDLHQTILKYESDVRRGDVDGIHDMRVSIRRLRVAMSNFAVCLSKQERRTLKGRLEGLAEALGGVRDLDVMIDRLGRSLAKRESSDRSALTPLMRRLKSRRRNRMHRLRAFLDGDEFAAFKHEFAALSEPATIANQELGNGQAA